MKRTKNTINWLINLLVIRINCYILESQTIFLFTKLFFHPKMYGHHPQVFDQSQTLFYNQPQPMYYGQPVYGQPAYSQPAYSQPIQPMYMQTPDPSIQQSPIIIIIDNKGASGIHCQQCGHDTTQIERKTIGCVAISWGVFIAVLQGCFVFCRAFKIGTRIQNLCASNAKQSNIRFQEIIFDEIIFFHFLH